MNPRSPYADKLNRERVLGMQELAALNPTQRQVKMAMSRALKSMLAKDVRFLIPAAKAASAEAVEYLHSVIKDPKLPHELRVSAAGKVLALGHLDAPTKIVADVNLTETKVITREELRSAALRLVKGTAEDVAC